LKSPGFKSATVQEVERCTQAADQPEGIEALANKNAKLA
jgi:hypothetical protein